MGPSPQVVFPLAFFVVNDGNKLYLILLQTMCCVICHSVTKITMSIVPSKGRKLGFITTNNMGGNSMKKHILDEHPIVWRMWKNVNVAFDSKELH